jgi:hypothetical protein
LPHCKLSHRWHLQAARVHRRLVLANAPLPTTTLLLLARATCRYYKCMTAIETRFPISNEKGNVKLSFPWTDAFRPAKKTSQVCGWPLNLVCASCSLVYCVARASPSPRALQAPGFRCCSRGSCRQLACLGLPVVAPCSGFHLISLPCLALYLCPPATTTPGQRAL